MQLLWWLTTGQLVTIYSIYHVLVQLTATSTVSLFFSLMLLLVGCGIVENALASVRRQTILRLFVYLVARRRLRAVHGLGLEMLLLHVGMRPSGALILLGKSLSLFFQSVVQISLHFVLLGLCALRQLL